MKSEPIRSFHIADGVALVAAAALAVALLKNWTEPNWCQTPWFVSSPAPSAAKSAIYKLSKAISYTLPFAITLTPTLLLVRIRRPRPRLGRIAFQRGAVACAAATIAMTVRMCEIGLGYALDKMVSPSFFAPLPSPPFMRWPPGLKRLGLVESIHQVVLECFPFMIAPSIGIAVMVAWTLLSWGGLARTERSWLDRAGRFMGYYWIAFSLSITLLSEFAKFIL